MYIIARLILMMVNGFIVWLFNRLFGFETAVLMVLTMVLTDIQYYDLINRCLRQESGNGEEEQDSVDHPG